jgi:hypothetical protein
VRKPFGGTKRWRRLASCVHAVRHRAVRSARWARSQATTRPFFKAFPTPVHHADPQPESSALCLTPARTGAP